jgi:cyclic peptide transporter
MHFLFELLKKYKGLYYKLFALTVVNSLWAICLLLIINNSAAQKTSGFSDPALYVYLSIILLSFISSRYFQSLLIKITSDTSYNFQKNILNELRLTSLRDFEKLNNERIYTAINDSRVISEFPESIIEFFNSLVFVICGFAYLIWLTPLGGTVVLGLILVLAARYVLSTKGIEKDVYQVRELEDSYYKTIEDFIRGFKQLKMSSVRADNFYGNFMDKNRKLTKDLSEKLYLRFMLNNLLGYYSWYLVIGFIIFVLPHMVTLQPNQVGMFTVSLLFLMSPLMSAVRLVPTFSRVKVAFSRLGDFIRDVKAKHKEQGTVEEGNKISSDFEFVRFHSLSFVHESSDDRTFTLGPINLHINKGEVVFVTGGNGSGKSTFISLLTGMYAPTQGCLYFNNYKIGDHNSSEYKDRIAAVFTDHHLFSENYDGFVLTDVNTELQEHIQLFKLENVIRLSTLEKLHPNLSKGQQKRLALIYALMEKKDILVLDEWAAEQDPEFREYFYNHILSDLASKGKTIIAVTHDDRYFHCATRVIKFEYGNIVVDQDVSERVPENIK